MKDHCLHPCALCLRKFYLTSRVLDLHTAKAYNIHNCLDNRAAQQVETHVKLVYNNCLNFFDGQNIAMALYAVSAGILSHLLFFIHGEHTLRAFTIAKAYLFTFTGTVVFLCLQSGMSYLGDFVIITTAYFTGLFLSIIAYRLLFHRLRSFNGPFAAKISKLYDLWMSRNFQYESAARSQWLSESMLIEDSFVAGITPRLRSFIKNMEVLCAPVCSPFKSKTRSDCSRPK